MDAEKLKKGRDLYLEILECREKHDVEEYYSRKIKELEEEFEKL